MIIAGIVLVLLIVAPAAWIKYVLWRYSTVIEDMPGSGGELAQHLVERFQLQGVKVLEGEEGKDHYNSEERVISLSPRVYRGKSLTAVAVAAHEVGHAIQFVRDEPVSRLRSVYLERVFKIKQLGSILLMALTTATLVLKIPHLFLLVLCVGLITMFASVLAYLAILPEELDASFNKALPILQDGYVPERHLPVIRKILRAAAFTYVAGALLDVLRLWRWIRLLR